ncbi:hypothetical protein EVAR_44859_1 [Eumeta japonica]|uniref:Uncharacterized protein n=1 Tax=Eumeta variegata TaxID=151549 RepID=A0A4C1Y4R5_EUMVA|nr:hypothetical protein EVAR_44859_1 [Eumeta japonica]
MRGTRTHARNICTCYRPARALATTSVQYSNARGREKERYKKVESKREKETKRVSSDVITESKYGIINDLSRILKDFLLGDCFDDVVSQQCAALK